MSKKEEGLIQMTPVQIQGSIQKILSNKNNKFTVEERYALKRSQEAVVLMASLAEPIKKVLVEQLNEKRTKKPVANSSRKPAPAGRPTKKVKK